MSLERRGNSSSAPSPFQLDRGGKPVLDQNGHPIFNAQYFKETWGLNPQEANLELPYQTTEGETYVARLGDVLIDDTGELCPFPLGAGLKRAYKRGGREEVLRSLKENFRYDLEQLSQPSPGQSHTGHSG